MDSHGIDVGSLAGQALTLIAAVFSVPVASLLTAWLYRLFTLAGVQVTDALRARLQAVVVNGLNSLAENAAANLKGRDASEIKQAVIKSTIDYVQRHAGDTITALGYDVHSQNTVEAIKGQIATAIVDPKIPTAPVLDAAVLVQDKR